MKKIVVLFSLGCFLNLPTFSTAHSGRVPAMCHADTFLAKDRTREAVKKYPLQNEVLMCAMKIAFIEPNKRNPEYTTCVNQAREEHCGKMAFGGTFNKKNQMNMYNGLKSHELRNKLKKCIELIHDCYDVTNLRNCQMRNESLF